ncbi:lysosomal acid glucosylceramidase-like isoform X2 [Leptopilina boulardi]|nr:lysosomal acid glucosylceramidase-like isoform X2 [Leptopilina boulardi]
MMLVLCFLALFSLAAANECIPRYFGDGSIVCVCNSTYCDSTPETNVAPRSFLWYSSTKSGRRMDLTVGKMSNTSTSSRTITIDHKLQYQEIKGFGGAFTDSAGINIRNLSETTQENLFNTYFGEDGSRYNIGRVPIGGTDFSTRFYTYDDINKDTLLRNFSLASEDMDFKIPLMQRALRINPEMQFLAAAWTAPAWMKTNDYYTGFGFLKKEYYQVYTDYILKFMDNYKKEGLEMWALSTGNEPSNAYYPINRINAMGWTSSGLGNWVANNLGPSLANSQHNQTLIITVDDQRYALPWSVDLIFKNNLAEKYISGIGIHWYWDSLVPAKVLDITHNHFPDKFLLITESCEGSFPWQNPKVRLGNWDRAESYVTQIIENLQHWSTGWIDWNLALDKTGGPTWINNNVDSPIIVNPETDEFFKQPMYYALHHFSRFLPRGSVRIASKDSSIMFHPLLSVAFQTPKNETVVVIYNRSGSFKEVDLVDSKNGIINLQLAPLSINTVVYSS